MNRLLKSFVVLFLCAVFLMGCVSDQKVRMDVVSTLSKDTLSKKFDVVLHKMEVADPAIKENYPTATVDYEDALIMDLRERKCFQDVEKQGGKRYSNALLVRSKIVSLKIVSTSARIWWGASAGNSEMMVELKFIDAKNGEVLREQVFTSTNNPYRGVITAGSSDKSLTADMGKMVAAYIAAIASR